MKQAGAIVPLIAGIGVAILIIILVGALGGKAFNLSEDKINEIGIIEVLNENFTAINGTAHNLSNSPIINGTLDCDNGTVMLVPTTDYTITLTTGVWTLINNTFNNTQIYCDYEYDNDDGIKDSVKGSISSSFEGLEQTGNYLPVIVLSIVIVLVLSMLVGLGGAFGQGGGGVM